jgi:hypothetical protein
MHVTRLLHIDIVFRMRLTFLAAAAAAAVAGAVAAGNKAS